MTRFLLRCFSGADRWRRDRGALGATRLMVISIALSSGTVAYADDFFEIDHIVNQGRSVAVEFAELNGDARTDLMVVTLIGIPPEETRSVRVYLQKPDGSLPREPDHTVPVPQRSAPSAGRPADGAVACSAPVGRRRCCRRPGYRRPRTSCPSRPAPAARIRPRS